MFFAHRKYFKSLKLYRVRTTSTFATASSTKTHSLGHGVECHEVSRVFWDGKHYTAGRGEGGFPAAYMK